MKELFVLSIFLLGCSTLFSQNNEEILLGNHRSGQFKLLKISENEFKFYLQSYRRLTSTGYSDRRQNYTVQEIIFLADNNTLINLKNQIISVFKTKESIKIKLGNKLLKIEPTESGSSLIVKIKGTYNFLSIDGAEELFKFIK